MMYRRRILEWIILLGLASSCSFAEKITIDPNIGPASAVKNPYVDARLAQKVTCKVRYAPVAQIVADLSTKTGVKLYAGYNKSDCTVRSRKMNIFVNDVTLADLMNSIARAMKFQWSRNDDVNPPTYRLIVDRKVAIAADAQKAGGDQKREEILRKRREDWAEVITRCSSMSGDQLESIRESDPIAYEYTANGIIPAVGALFSEVPETQDRFLAGRSFRIAANDLSARTRGLVYTAGDNFSRRIQSKFGQKPTGYGDRFKPEEDFDFVFSRFDMDGFSPNSRWGDPKKGRVGMFYIARPVTGQSVIGDLPARDRACEQLISAAINGANTPAPPDASGTTDKSPVMSREAEQEKQEESLYPSEPLNDHSLPLPGLEKKVKLKVQPPPPGQTPALSLNNYIASFQEALHEATGLGVVSDSWVNIDSPGTPHEEAGVQELLDQFSRQFNYNWDMHSGILEFRHRKWWKMRMNQIPDEWVTAWSKRTSKNGFLSLDDLAQISTLTYEQAEESVKPDDVLGITSIYREMITTLDKNGAVIWLRLYALLSPQLRSQLMAHNITGAMLSPDQWNVARIMFDRVGSLRSDALFALRASQSEDRFTYEFREFEVDSKKEDRRWSISLPVYKPATGQDGAKPVAKEEQTNTH